MPPQTGRQQVNTNVFDPKSQIQNPKMIFVMINFCTIQKWQLRPKLFVWQPKGKLPEQKH